MSALETAVAPILTPMMEGQPTQLDLDDTRALRFWAMKTALNIAYDAQASFRSPVPDQFAQEIYARRQNREAIPNFEVWVAKYDPLGQFAYRHMTALGYGKDPVTKQLHKVLRVVFVAGHAVFYVRMPDSAEAQGLGQRAPLTQFTLLFDPPPNRTIIWCRGSVDDSGISETFNRHIHGGIYQGQDADVWSAP